MLNLKSNKHPDNVVNKNKISQRPVVFLLLGAAAISLTPIFVRLSELGPSATAFYRVFFAPPVFFCGCIMIIRVTMFIDNQAR
jgi:hypothetical protein